MPLPPPGSESHAATPAQRADVEAWAPYVHAVLDRHDLRQPGAPIRAGHNPTFPTFVAGEVVVKFFGATSRWKKSHGAELAAYRTLGADPALRVPRLLAADELVPGGASPWPYLVMERVPGTSWRDARLTSAEQSHLAAELGEEVRRVHALIPTGVPTLADWGAADAAGAAARTSLPPHLVEQVEAYVAALPPPDLVFLHADLCANHVFVEGGRITGLIDWGDALRADPHLDLIQIQRDTFGLEKDLLRIFLDAYGWAPAPDFARRALGHALLRQAVGLQQHRGMDVFEPVAERHELERVPTLEALAELVFGL